MSPKKTMLPVLLPVCTMWPWTSCSSLKWMCASMLGVFFPLVGDSDLALRREPVFLGQFLRLQNPLPFFPPPSTTLSFSPPTFVLQPRYSLVQYFLPRATSISLLLSATVAISWYARAFQCLLTHPPISPPVKQVNGFKIPFAFSYHACSWLRDLPSLPSSWSGSSSAIETSPSGLADFSTPKLALLPF